MIDAEGVLAVLLAVVAALAVGAYVGWPLARGRRGSPSVQPAISSGGSDEWGGLLEERRALLGALRELEHDRERGSLSADDHAALRDAYEQRGVALYRALDTAMREREAALGGAVEREKKRLLAEGGNEVLAPSRAAGVASPPVDVDAGASTVGGRGAAAPGRRLAVGAGLASGVFLLLVGGLWLVAIRERATQAPVAAVVASGYHALFVDPVAPSRVYLGTPGRLFVSQDGGRHWASGPATGSDVRSVARVGDDLVAVGSGTVIRSTDGGASWRAAPAEQPAGDARALAASPLAPRRIYAALGDHRLLRSDDAAATWADVGRLPAGVRALAVVPTAAGGDAIYAAGDGLGVVVSQDGGGSWSGASGFVNGALPTTHVVGIAYDGRSGDTADSVVGSFRGALVVATDRGLFRSTDGGASWSRLPLDADTAAVALDPASGAILAVDTGGRVFRGTNRGSSWNGRE